MDSNDPQSASAPFDATASLRHSDTRHSQSPAYTQPATATWDEQIDVTVEELHEKLQTDTFRAIRVYNVHHNHDALRSAFPGLRSCPIEELTFDDLFVSSSETIPAIILDLKDHDAEWNMKKLIIRDDNIEMFRSQSVDSLQRSRESRSLGSSLFLRIEDFYMTIKPLVQLRNLQEINLGVFIPPLGTIESCIPQALQSMQEEIDGGIDKIPTCQEFIWEGTGQTIREIMDQHTREHDTNDNLFPRTCIECEFEWLDKIEAAIDTFCEALGNNLYHLRQITVRSIFSSRDDWSSVYRKHEHENFWVEVQ